MEGPQGNQQAAAAVCIGGEVAEGLCTCYTQLQLNGQQAVGKCSEGGSGRGSGKARVYWGREVVFGDMCQSTTTMRFASSRSKAVMQSAVWYPPGAMVPGGGVDMQGGAGAALAAGGIGGGVVVVFPLTAGGRPAAQIVVSSGPVLGKMLPLLWAVPIQWNVTGGNNRGNGGGNGGQNSGFVSGAGGGGGGSSSSEDSRAVDGTEAAVGTGGGVGEGLPAVAPGRAPAAEPDGGQGNARREDDEGDSDGDSDADASVETSSTAGPVIQGDMFMQHMLQSLLQVWLGWLNVLFAPARWYGNMVWALTEGGFGLGLWFVELFVWWLLLPLRVLWWVLMSPVRAVHWLIMMLVGLFMKVLQVVAQLFPWSS